MATEYLTVQEVAKIFKVKPKRIYECLEEGKFPNARKPLGGWLIPRADVDKLLPPAPSASQTPQPRTRRSSFVDRR